MLSVRGDDVFDSQKPSTNQERMYQRRDVYEVLVL
jgi:hypothetical protein